MRRGTQYQPSLLSVFHSVYFFLLILQDFDRHRHHRHSVLLFVPLSFQEALRIDYLLHYERLVIHGQPGIVAECNRRFRDTQSTFLLVIGNTPGTTDGILERADTFFYYTCCGASIFNVNTGNEFSSPLEFVS